MGVSMYLRSTDNGRGDGDAKGLADGDSRAALMAAPASQF